MPRKDTTFSHKDVLRIYNRHLDQDERDAVAQVLGLTGGPELLAWAEDVYSGAQLFHSDAGAAAIALKVVAEAIDKAAKELNLGDPPAPGDIVKFTTRIIEDMDGLIRNLRAIAATTPFENAIEVFVESLIRLRRSMRAVLAILSLPATIIESRDAIDALGDAMFDLETHLVSTVRQAPKTIRDANPSN